jgi:CHAT domain-containing protein/tetratricopeptide (TPR) repeat protein
VDVAGSCYNLGWLYERLADWPRAETFYRRAVRTLEQSAAVADADLVPALDGLAGFLRQRGMYAESKALYSRLLTILERNGQGDTPQAASALNDRAMVVRLDGRPMDAEPLYVRAIAILEAALGPDAPDVGSLHGNLALAYLDGGRFGKAEAHLDRMQAIFDAKVPAGHPARATLASYRAMLHSVLGEPDRAEALDRQALAIREATLHSDDPLRAASIHALGVNDFALGWFDDAAERLHNAIAFRERVLGADHPDTSETRNSLAAVLEAEGQHAEAETMFRQAFQARERVLGPLHPKTLTSLNNLAAVLESLERYEDAANLYDRAIAAAAEAWPPTDPRHASLLNNRALLCAALGSMTDAERLYERALSIEEAALEPNDRRLADTVTNLAVVRWASGRPEDACPLLRRSAAIHENLLRLLMNAGSERQKRASLETAQMMLSAIVTLHLRALPGSPAARDLAVDVVLQRKGRLLDGLARPLDALSGLLGEGGAVLVKQWKAVRGERAALATAGSEAVNQLDRAAALRELQKREEEIESAIGDLARPLPDLGVVSCASVCGALEEGTALLEFIRYIPFVPAAARADGQWTGPRYGGYLLSRNGVRSYADLGDAPFIEAAVGQLRDALGQSGTGYEKPARDLYQLLLEPLGLEPRQWRHILISADGLINAVPFAVLLTPEHRHLIDLVSVSNLYSGRDVVRWSPSTESGPVVVFGGPDFSKPGGADAPHGYMPLAGALREAELIRVLLPSAEIVTGANASKAALKKHTRPLLLHIATHGEYREPMPHDPGSGDRLQWRDDMRPLVGDSNPLLASWLALAGANESDGRGEGIITALEVTTLDLRGTELVTLSACDTAVGAVRAGDGIYGLARAFLLAGARSLLVSLWELDDDSTCEMMRLVYTQLCVGTSRVKALCNVQRELMRTAAYGHPFYWSGFVLVGNAGGIPALARRASKGALDTGGSTNTPQSNRRG